MADHEIKAAEARFVLLSVFMAFLSVTVSGSCTWGASEISDTAAVPEAEPFWTRLVFESTGRFVTVRAEIGLLPGYADWPVPDRLKGVEISLPDHGEVMSTDNSTMIMTVKTEASGFASPDTSYVQAVKFNSYTAQALQRVRWRCGRNGWIKVYQWGKKGVRRTKFKVKKDSGPWSGREKWVSTSSFYSYPVEISKCRVISETTLIPYLISSPMLRHSDELFHLCVFGKKQLHRLTLKGLKRQVPSALRPPEKVKYILHSPGADEIEACGRADMIFTVTSQPFFAGHDNKHEKFSFLGLQEAIRIEIDSTGNLPVRISGVNSTLGNMVFMLKEAWLR